MADYYTICSKVLEHVEQEDIDAYGISGATVKSGQKGKQPNNGCTAHK